MNALSMVVYPLFVTAMIINSKTLMDIKQGFKITYTIDPKKHYSLLDIVKLGVMGKSHHSVSSAILRDKFEGKNLLQVTVTGVGKGSRYRVKGKYLLAYLRKI